jgi:uncharacterized protein YjbI with pentapeptide repeats
MTQASTLTTREPLKLDLSGAFARRTDLSGANLEGANLSDADLTNAVLRNANLKDANLKGTILRGADLRWAKNLTKSQVKEAVIDEKTLLPDDLNR